MAKVSKLEIGELVYSSLEESANNYDYPIFACVDEGTEFETKIKIEPGEKFRTVYRRVYANRCVLSGVEITATDGQVRVEETDRWKMIK
jgi:predicted restriction endonuclease